MVQKKCPTKDKDWLQNVDRKKCSQNIFKLIKKSVPKIKTTTKDSHEDFLK